MGIEIQSTSDTKEAVTAAMADLATKVEEKPVEPAKEEESPKEEPKDDEVKEPVESEEESEGEDESSDEEKEEEDAEVAAKDASDKPKKKGGFQKKIEKRDKIISDKDQEINFLRQQLMTKTPNPTAEPKIETQPNLPLPGMPKETEFENVRDYEKALIRWEVKQELLEEKRKESLSAFEREKQVKLQKHSERFREFIKNDEDLTVDWKQTIDLVGNNIPMTLHDEIVDSDVGPSLMRFLSDNPDEMRRICTLPYQKIAKELGKLEVIVSSKKSASPAKEKTKTSKVPSPVKTVRAKGSTPIGYREDMSQREYETWRNQKSGKGA